MPFPTRKAPFWGPFPLSIMFLYQSVISLTYVFVPLALDPLYWAETPYPNGPLNPRLFAGFEGQPYENVRLALKPLGLTYPLVSCIPVRQGTNIPFFTVITPLWRPHADIRHLSGAAPPGTMICSPLISTPLLYKRRDTIYQPVGRQLKSRVNLRIDNSTDER